MDDTSRPSSDQYQDSTRWLLLVLVTVAVLAAGVIAVSDVPGLVGNKWQVVGAASAAVTLLALLVAVFVVLRALDPVAEEDPVEASAMVDLLPAPVPAAPAVVEASAPEAADETDRADEADQADQADSAAQVPDGRSRRAHRQAVTRYHRARSLVGFAVVLAFLGMTGMVVAAVVDGNNVEARQRRTIAAQLAVDEDGPITEPHAVAVQFTTPGLRRVADAMGCTGQQVGFRPVQGWAVSGTYRNPTVVLFGPTPACKNVELGLAPRDGFVYPTVGPPTASTRPATRPATTRPATTPTSTPAAGTGQFGQGAPAANGQGAPTPTSTPAAP